MVIFKPICSRTINLASDEKGLRRIVKLRRPDGIPIAPGELVVGKFYDIDLDTGHVRPAEWERA